MKDAQDFYFLFLKLNRKDRSGMTSHPFDFKAVFSLETLTEPSILDMTRMLCELTHSSYDYLHKVKPEFLHR